MFSSIKRIKSRLFKSLRPADNKNRRRLKSSIAVILLCINIPIWLVIREFDNSWRVLYLFLFVVQNYLLFIWIDN